MCKKNIGYGALVIRGYKGICVCERDRLGVVIYNGDIRMCVCVCQRDRLRGASGKV